MRRLRHWALNTLAALSLSLSVFSLVLWPLSFWLDHLLGRLRTGIVNGFPTEHRRGVFSSGGALLFATESFSLPDAHYLKDVAPTLPQEVDRVGWFVGPRVLVPGERDETFNQFRNERYASGWNTLV